MKKIYLPFIAFSISLASCSKTPPNASNTEITDALKMLISAVDFSQSATYEKDLLLESIHVYSASCNNTSKQDLLCSVSFNYAKRNAEGKINNLQTSRPDLLINMRYRENGWQIDADKFDVDEIINTAKLALEPQASEAPQAAVSNPMPSDWFGKWIGSGNVGSFGMSAAVSLSVVEQGAVFKVENCSGGTTAEMKASDGAFSVLPIGPCDPGSFRVKSADSESMIVSIPRGGKYLDIKLVRAIGIHDDISVFPNSSVDIMNFPIGGPNSIREAAAKLKLRPFASGNEFRMEDIAASSDRISIGNRTGEAFVILFEKDVEEDESDNNRSLAFLRYFIPSEQNSPSFKETQIGLIEKYGEPSLRFNENKYAWLYTDQGIKLNGDNVKMR